MIAVSLLRPPSRPARTVFDEDALDELARSIRDFGRVHTPLQVRALEDGTFEIVAGHRRYLAAHRIGLIEVPCIVAPGAELHALRASENLDREDWSPTDEARYYRELLAENGDDVDRVCALVKRSRARVEGRLLLLRGNQAVFDALDRGDITIGVAEQLNRFKLEGDCAFHLPFAIRTGATVAQVREWVERCNAQANATAGAASAVAQAGLSLVPATAPAPAPADPLTFRLPHETSSSLEPRPCLFCNVQDQEYRMFRKFVCSGCYQTHLVPLEAARAKER